MELRVSGAGPAFAGAPGSAADRAVARELGEAYGHDRRPVAENWRVHRGGRIFARGHSDRAVHQPLAGNAVAARRIARGRGVYGASLHARSLPNLLPQRHAMTRSRARATLTRIRMRCLRISCSCKRFCAVRPDSPTMAAFATPIEGSMMRVSKVALAFVAACFT